MLVRFIPTSSLTVDGAAHFLFTEGGASDWSPSSQCLASPLYGPAAALQSLRAELGLADLVATTSYQGRDPPVIRDPMPLFRSFKIRATCAAHFTSAVCAISSGFAAHNAHVEYGDFTPTACSCQFETDHGRIVR